MFWPPTHHTSSNTPRAHLSNLSEGRNEEGTGSGHNVYQVRYTLLLLLLLIYFDYKYFYLNLLNINITTSAQDDSATAAHKERHRMLNTAHHACQRT